MAVTNLNRAIELAEELLSLIEIHPVTLGRFRHDLDYFIAYCKTELARPADTGGK